MRVSLFIHSALLLLIVLLLLGCSTVKKLEKRPIALINNVSYIDAKFNNANASNGFLVAYKKKSYAITAKHILMIAKTDAMTFVDFEGQLKQWKMHPKTDSTSYVLIDKLLSVSRTDSLTWNYLDTNWETYNDWLVFSIKENKTQYSPLKARTTALKKGELLYAVGWTYNDTIGTQRVYEYTYNKTEGHYHNLIQLKGPKSLGGLSGAPIVDKSGRVVGLVSSGGKDENTKQITLEATDIKPVFDFISKLN